MSNTHSFRSLAMSQTTLYGSMTVKRAAAAIAVLGVWGAAGAVVAHQNTAVAAAPVALPAAAAAAATAPAVAVPAPLMTLPEFSVIAAHNGPAVVNISVTGSTKTGYDGADIQGRRGDPFGDDPFFEFFRRFQGPQ